jgi:hypothetical protein
LSKLTRAAARLRREWHKARFAAVARQVLDTSPLDMAGHAPVFVTQICERDVHAYLLAIKSLYRRIGTGSVHIIDDGSLTPASRTLLAHHLPRLTIEPMAAIDVGPCPRGGCWERLCRAVDLSRECYVIQIDADTLTLADVPEVRDCLARGTSFLLGTDSGQAIATAAEVAAMVRGWIARHRWTSLSLSVEAEASLDRLPDPSAAYVHASAGFAGFARGSVAIGDLHRFSDAMATLLGRARWASWGSEQIASNHILANAPGAVVLPFPRYACAEPHVSTVDSALVHFIGSYRHATDLYRSGARRALGLLR